MEPCIVPAVGEVVSFTTLHSAPEGFRSPLHIAIVELEAGRKKAMAELVAYKATAKQLDNDIEKHRAKAAEWERRAILAVKPDATLPF